MGKYGVFFKIGIVRFVLISAAAGYFLGLPVESEFYLSHFLCLLLGTFLISSGSLALNQIQEVEQDSLMARTKDRPIANGEISYGVGVFISSSFMILGTMVLMLVSLYSALIGAVIIILYNGFYTPFWKKKWSFAAVPGAIPGALPCTLGFAAINPNVFSSESWYLFLIMFLWQMPHFWTLAIKLKDDYKAGGFPILPVVMGKERTLYHISFYVWGYVFLSLISPLFVPYGSLYLWTVIPFAILVLISFTVFIRSENPKMWLPFFLITNFSMLAFIFAPVGDKWIPLIFNS